MSMKFIDLFAGLGGFHLALRRLGHQCVFACEIDPTLRDTYAKNFGMVPAADIRDVTEADIPAHDILCAGFPCQPFSKAGAQQGFDDPRWGDLFGHVLRIIQHHLPTYIILENVPNLERHRGGQTWRSLHSCLAELGYDVARRRLSPHHFGIPQIRDRLFIIASRVEFGFEGFPWPNRDAPHVQPSLVGLLEKNPPDARRLSPKVERCLELWQDFLVVSPD